MAEHVFESPLVEEFYNSCHLKSNGKFCGGKTKAKVAHQVPMSDRARKSNAILRGLKAARNSKPYKAQRQANRRVDAKYNKMNAERRAKYAAKKSKTPEDIRPGKEASGLTAKYGARRTSGAKAPAAAPKATTAKSAKTATKKTPENIRPGAESKALTQKYGARTAKATKPKVTENLRPGSEAAKLTAKYGSRRG